MTIEAVQHTGDTGHILWDLVVENLPPAKPAHDRLRTAVEGHSGASRRAEDDLRELAATALDTAPELSRLIMDRIESSP